MPILKELWQFETSGHFFWDTLYIRNRGNTNTGLNFGLLRSPKASKGSQDQAQITFMSEIDSKEETLSQEGNMQKKHIQSPDAVCHESPFV